MDKTVPDSLAILQPLHLGRGKVEKTLKNRVIMPAHSYNLNNDDGSPDVDRLTAYVAARILGGVAMVVLGETYVPDPIFGDEQTWGAARISEKSLVAYGKIVRIAHENDCLIVDQLCHTGGQFGAEVDGGVGNEAYAPSAVSHASFGAVPRAMTSAEVRAVVAYYANAAALAKRAGLDGVEIKADQGKLPHQFLSPLFNRRDDEYGPHGPNGRFKFMQDVLVAVRQAIGDEILLGIRLPCDTGELGDLDFAQCRDNILKCVQTGLLDYVSVNGATNSTPRGYLVSHGDDTVVKNVFADPSRSIRAEVRKISDIPVFLATRIVTPADAEAVIQSQAADVVAMARANIADPEFVKKIWGGQESRIRECIGCSQSCVGNTWEGRTIACIYNPEAGHETKVPSSATGWPATALASLAMPTPIENLGFRNRIISPHYVVIGGGPAGLEATRTALQAGARVTLFDGSEQLGGSVRNWAQMDSRRTYQKIYEWLLGEIDFYATSSNLQVHSGHTARAIDILSCQSDYIFVATGGLPSRQDNDLPNAVHASQLRFAELGAVIKPKSRVIIAAESWLQGGLHIAYELAKLGHHVVVTSSGEFSRGMDFVTHTSIMGRLRAFDRVSVHSHSTVRPSYVKQAWQIEDLLNGAQTVVDAELVIRCDGIVPNNALSVELARLGLTHNLVGDARKFGGIELAIREARAQIYRTLEVEKQLEQNPRSLNVH